MDKDVTKLIEFGNNDDKSLPIYKCICGEEFYSWEFVISIYRETPSACPKCGRKFYFKNTITIFKEE